MGLQGAPRRTGWKQWKPEQAKRALAAWRASGLPLATYARGRGVSARRLSWWRERLEEWSSLNARAETEDARLVPANITARTMTTATSAMVTVRLRHGVELELADVATVPADWVAELAVKLWRAG